MSDPSHRICALGLIGPPALRRVIAGALEPGTVDLLLRAALLNGTILIQTDGALVVVACLGAT
jgi:HEAT repeat protein